MWIPDFFYDKLPAVYLAGAALSLILLGRAGVLSAILFCGAAALTVWWRRDDRS